MLKKIIKKKKNTCSQILCQIPQCGEVSPLCLRPKLINNNNSHPPLTLFLVNILFFSVYFLFNFMRICLIIFFLDLLRFELFLQVNFLLLDK